MCRTGFMPRMLVNSHDVIQHLCEHHSDEYATAAVAAVETMVESESERSVSTDGAAKTRFDKSTSPHHQPTAAEACGTSPPSVSTSPSRFARIRVSPAKAAAPTSTVPAGEPVTVFHSRTLPTLSLFELGCEINRRSKCGEECLLIALVLMKRYCDAAKVHPTAHMMHRLYITCLHVGMKAHSDDFFNNPTFARIVGIEPRELNVLERELITVLDWRVQVSDSQITAITR